MSICLKCGVADPEDERGYQYIPSIVTDRTEQWCGPCAVAQWECPIQFTFHVGVPDEVRQRFVSLDMLKRLCKWAIPHKHLPVHVFHRREAERVIWMEKWGLRRHGMPEKPYSYRGWCAWNEIILLWDETETVDSLEWILYHEIGHAVCNRTPMFDDAMARENTIQGRTGYEWQDDEGHEADSEERLVNRVATSHMGGKEWARPWWRPRVIAKERGYSVLPNAFAPENSPEFEMFRFAVAEGWTARRKDGTMLAIKGFEYSKAGVNLNPARVSEEERQHPDFREYLNTLLNPRKEPTPAVVESAVLSHNGSTWSE